MNLFDELKAYGAKLAGEGAAELAALETALKNTKSNLLSIVDTELMKDAPDVAVLKTTWAKLKSFL